MDISTTTTLTIDHVLGRSWHQAATNVDPAAIAITSLFAWLSNVPGVPYCIALLQLAYYQLFLRPAAYFYFGGPKLHGWGMWGGDPLHEICGKILSPPASLWLQPGAPVEECTRAVLRHFDAFIISIHFVIYIYALYRLVCWLMQCCTVSNLILRPWRLLLTTTTHHSDPHASLLLPPQQQPQPLLLPPSSTGSYVLLPAPATNSCGIGVSPKMSPSPVVVDTDDPEYHVLKRLP